MLSSADYARISQTAPYEAQAVALHRAHNLIKGVWDFAVDGGAVGQINLKDDKGNIIVLPVGAIVTKCYLDIITTLTSGGSATIAVGSQASGDLKAATAVASYSAGLLASDAVGTVATMKKIATSDKPLRLDIAVAALTAGKAKVFVEFVLSDAT